MLRRIKRFLGFSNRGAYFPNDEVAPAADGSLLSNASRKSTKSEKKLAKKEKKKSPLAADISAPAIIHVPTPPSNIDDTIDRQTVVTDSLPYREPSDKIFMESPNDPPVSCSSTRSLVGSTSMNSRLDTLTIDGVSSVAIPHVASSIDSIYSGDMALNAELGACCDAKSREMPVDCEIPNEMTESIITCKSTPVLSMDNVSPLQMTSQTKLDHLKDLAGQPEDVHAMKKFNDELNGLLKASAPFHVSSARLPPMKELPPPEDSMSSGQDEFDDSKNNSVARYLNESHEVMMRSPETKHLRSCGF